MPVSLHTHSWYSFLEGVASPAALLDRAAACGYPTLALTDTNNLCGAVPFVDEAQRRGIRPILGARLRQPPWQCVALIGDPTGYRNLCRIISRIQLSDAGRAGGVNPPVTEANHSFGSVTGGLTPPARLVDLLNENAEGLQILVDDPALVPQLREAFGPRLWLEIVRPGNERAARREAELLAAGKRLGVRPVASCAAHAAVPGEYRLVRLVTAVRQLTLLEQVAAQLSITAEHHLIDAPTWSRRFGDLPQAVYNTDVLAGQLRSDVLPRDLVLPPARLPRGLDEVHYLRLLCERGLRRRELGECRDARQRLREELAVIEAGELAGYFLVVRDIARHARQHGHPMALRGSAGNSLVCYLLEITDVNPLRFGLAMERFLHPGRRDLPDIDLDFDWKVRDEVLEHVFQRWGRQHTAMICTHLSLQPRSAFREAGKIHGLSSEQVTQLLPAMDQAEWGDEGTDPEGKGDLTILPPTGAPVPRSFPLEPARWPRILRDARLLLGRPHHLSIHPGGVVITHRPIEDHVPLQMAPKGVVITQLDKDAIEQIGLVKIDLLGNRALGTVEEAERIARGLRTRTPCADDTPSSVLPRKSAHGVRVALAPRPIDPAEPAIIAMLQAGDTLGVCQLESPAMRHLAIQMKPESVDHVIQALALIRPAAASIGAKELFVRRRRGLEPVDYFHPCLEPVLRETYGVILFEDDSLHVTQAMMGIDPVAADRFRKRVAKHRTEQEARELEVEFRTACTKNGIPADAARATWTLLPKFNRYSFCKSHAVSYGLIAWQAAYLKAHYPLAFWTAVLNNNQGMYPQRVYVEAIKRAGIAVRLPCVNHSARPFAMEGPAIRTGLDAIASLDEALQEAIIAEREKHGPYRSLADFRERVQLGPEALALLIRCGALDCTGQTRPELFAEVERSRREPQASACRTLPFGSRRIDDGDDWRPPDYANERRLRDEWEILGFSVGVPLMSLFRHCLPGGLVDSRQLREHVGRRVRVAGLVATARTHRMEDGRDVQFVTLQDEYDLTEVSIFPGACPLHPYLRLGPYVVTGMVEERYGVVAVTAERFEEAGR